jgi:pyridoxamine 5'-phosphate oxidase-like protein
MATWAELETAAPDLAAEGYRLLHARGHGEVLLATIRGEGLPRISAISVAIVDGRLYAFIIIKSAKLLDLARDGRYAMHTHVDEAAPSEFAIRGHATVVLDKARRAAVAAGWTFEVDDDYRLFEFSIDAALLGIRNTADEWPPRYTSWRSPDAAG